MKLASLKTKNRDGELIIVSKDLKRYTSCKEIAPTMQSALDNWNQVQKKLNNLSKMLNNDEVKSLPFDETSVHSPLPRAYQWADGSAYVNHVNLVRKARGAKLPESFWTDPLMYQGGSDDFIPPQSPILLPDETWGIDMEAELAVITNDVPMGTKSNYAEEKILLIMLVNDISLRNLIPSELSKGFGFFQSKPSTSFSPVAVTLDEVDDFWAHGKLNRIMEVDLNDQPLGRVNTSIDMTFNFPQLISHASKSRKLGAGTIIGSGTISNRDKNGGPGLPIDKGGDGYSCLAELRMVETIKYGNPKTPFMDFGDKVRIEIHDNYGQSIFGKIDQKVEKLIY